MKFHNNILIFFNKLIILSNFFKIVEEILQLWNECRNIINHKGLIIGDKMEPKIWI